jgi:hypothetical protein
VKLRREVVLVGADEAELLSRRSHNESRLGGQDGGQRSGDRALAAAVDP